MMRLGSQTPQTHHKLTLDSPLNSLLVASLETLPAVSNP